jgi:hypothetical protein
VALKGNFEQLVNGLFYLENIMKKLMAVLIFVIILSTSCQDGQGYEIDINATEDAMSAQYQDQLLSYEITLINNDVTTVIAHECKADDNDDSSNAENGTAYMRVYCTKREVNGRYWNEITVFDGVVQSFRVEN